MWVEQEIRDLDHLLWADLPSEDYGPTGAAAAMAIVATVAFLVALTLAALLFV